LIAKEYLSLAEPVQVRKNAVTALAALDDEESRALLAEMAVTDASPEVKQKARDEIVAMPEESSQQILQLVLRDLETEERQRTAYVLLGELSNKGLK
jgi:HEAT repeat protein